MDETSRSSRATAVRETIADGWDRSSYWKRRTRRFGEFTGLRHGAAARSGAEAVAPRVSSQADQKENSPRSPAARQGSASERGFVYGVDTTREGGFLERFCAWADADVLLQCRVVRSREAALVGIDLCKALSAVHAAGLLHRDIKASNAIAKRWTHLLMDFGFLWMRRSAALGGTRPTWRRVVYGRTGFMASDIYALGILLITC